MLSVLRPSGYFKGFFVAAYSGIYGLFMGAVCVEAIGGIGKILDMCVGT